MTNEPITPEELELCAGAVDPRTHGFAGDDLLRAAAHIRDLQARLAEAEKQKVPEGIPGFQSSSGKKQGVFWLIWTHGEFDLDVQRFADGTWQWEVRPTLYGKYDTPILVDPLRMGYADDFATAIRAAQEADHADAE